MYTHKLHRDKISLRVPHTCQDQELVVLHHHLLQETIRDPLLLDPEAVLSQRLQHLQDP